MDFSIKRKYLRAPINELVTIHDDDGYSIMRSGTISEKGMFVYCSEPIFNQGTELRFYIKLKDSPKAILPAGEIINYIDSYNKGFCIKFTDITDEDQMIIKAFVKRNFSKLNSTAEFLIPFYKSLRKFKD
jgi:hypothetical protein